MPRRSLHITSLHCSARPLQLSTTRKIGERIRAQHGLITASSASQSSSASSAASAVDDDSAGESHRRDVRHGGPAGRRGTAGSASASGGSSVSSSVSDYYYSGGSSSGPGYGVGLAVPETNQDRLDKLLKDGLLDYDQYEKASAKEHQSRMAAARAMMQPALPVPGTSAAGEAALVVTSIHVD